MFMKNQNFRLMKIGPYYWNRPHMALEILMKK